jgi:putative glutamine amidotransferase
VLRTSAGEIDNHTLAHTYSDSVIRAGGVPILLAPVPDTMVPSLLDHLDGLVLSGGGDVDPQRYGGAEHESMYDLDYDRDEFEIQLVQEAARRRTPTLAICRGMQVMNVALGGTLIEDIPSEIGSADHTVIGHAVYDGHQRVTIEESSRVGRAVCETELLVNSIHHQAVRDLAPGFRAVAWAGDGVIEAMEHEDPAWDLLAVQWHPEYLGAKDDKASWRLFRALVEAAGADAGP